jgi:hypothetical protein
LWTAETKAKGGPTATTLSNAARQAAGAIIGRMLALAPLLALVATTPAPALRARSVPSVAAAVEALLARQPRVVAFGELHQTSATLGVPSSLKHFTDELLAVLAPRASDLVVETWVTQGKCGKTEEAVVADVARTTERPAQTENEVLTLIQRARAAGIKPHILGIACREYEAIYRKDGVDYEALLRLTSEKLESGVREVLGRPGARDDRAVVVYGGALHNDLAPPPGMSAFAFGESLSRTVGGKYLEIDLYVPEYVARQKRLRAEPWYAAYRRAARPGQAVVVERSLDSYVIVFARAARRPGRGAGK